MSKLASLGTTNSPGCEFHATPDTRLRQLIFLATFAMYNNAGAPAFKPNVTYTANPGAYEVDTDTDFTSNMNFLVGLGGTDDSGRMKSLASVIIIAVFPFLTWIAD